MDERKRLAVLGGATFRQQGADSRQPRSETVQRHDKEAVSRISNIVSSLKKFVRLDEAELQEADINKELDLTLDLIRHETKNKIEIVKNYGEIPMIKCFPNMLNQVFMNILVNACQAIEEERFESDKSDKSDRSDKSDKLASPYHKYI